MENKRFATYICCIIVTLFAFNLTAISPMLIEISNAFSLGTAQSGLLFTFQFAGFILFVLVGGILSDKYGKKLITAISLIGFTITIFIFPFSSVFLWACIIMFFIGGFGGAMESVVTALISDINKVNTNFYVNLSQVFFGFGAIAGPLTVSYIVNSGSRWKSFYIYTAVFSFIVSTIFILTKFNEEKTDKSFQIEDVKRLFLDKKFLLICLCMLFYTGSEVGGWGWMSTFLKDALGFNMVRSGLSVAVFWGAMTVGRFFCGVLTLKFNISKIVITLALLSGITTLFATWVTNSFFIWIIIILMGLFYSSLWPLIASYGNNYVKGMSGTVFSVLIASGGAGSMTVPYFMGSIGEMTGLGTAMLIPSVLMILTGFIFIGLKKTDKKDAVIVNV